MGADVLKVLAALQEVVPEAVKLIRDVPGIVHKCKPAVINDVKGLLIWEYLLYNEIYFRDMNGNEFTLYHSASNKKTKKKWKKYKELFCKKQKTVCEDLDALVNKEMSL